MEEAMSQPKLLFVYAVDSGVLNTAKDVIHKIVSPSTYPCSLCAITYGTVRQVPEWARFVRGLSMRVEYLHRDELRKRHPRVAHSLPVVLLEQDGLDVLVASHEIDACRGATALARLVDERLRARTQRLAG
jgi:hypothetical protein